MKNENVLKLLFAVSWEKHQEQKKVESQQQNKKVA